MEKQDVVIIGGGPAGLTASVYTSRSNLKTLFIEKGAPGGKMVKTFKIENWSGDVSVSGPDLSMRMFSHAKAYGGNYKYGEVTNIVSNSEFDHVLELASGEKIQAKAVVIATGMVERVPESIKGIHEFENKGVSYCIICDGPLFKGKNIAVIGGGNSAIEESQFAAQFSKHVYVFVRSEKDLIADKSTIDQLKAKENVTILLNAEITELVGGSSIEYVKAIVNGQLQDFDVQAVFPYVGQIPVSNFAKSLNITDERGYIPTDEFMETSTKGIYAIGDIRKKEIRQIATAASDGTIVGKILANRL